RIENQLIIQRQKKQLQQEIKERRKTEKTLRVYLHAVSHDLRNPVIGLSMVLKNLLKKNQDKPGDNIEISWKVLEQMSKSCDRQLNLINSLVETQQFEMGGISLNCRPLNLCTFSQQLAAVWQPMLKEKKAILHLNVASDLPLINGDSDRLWRVFDNLIANALKHNDLGIQLTLKAEVVETSVNNLNSLKIHCTLEDNGKGIPPEQIATLFERYQRGEEAKNTLGLGLGLYLCRQIIEAHGGEIGVMSDQNQGAKFWLTLPVVDVK
ncbi:MAG: HAMP domain-containing sensor histidine kinase, partial [Cyanobacteria bacterium P01_G01_bin.49]